MMALNTAATALAAQFAVMDIATHNLANANTHGYKKSDGEFADLMYQTYHQPGAPSSEQTILPTGLQIGTGTRLAATVRRDSQGSLSITNDSKDVAIKGAGYFQVQLPDGSTAYTRNGSFQVDQNGQLVTIHGFPIQPAITLPANATNIEIASDGTISVTQQGQTAPVILGQLMLSTFINTAGLESLGDNLYQETQASGVPMESSPGLNGVGLLHQGAVEESNVVPTEEYIKVIKASQNIGFINRIMKHTDEAVQKTTQL